MRCPTVPTLMENFRDLTEEDARKIRKLAKLTDDAEGLREYIAAHCEATHAYARQCYSDPFDSYMWRVTMALHAIDKVLGTHGVEALGSSDTRNGPPYEYCNTGDAYAATLIYNRDRDTLFVGCWGDIAEHLEEDT